MRLLRQSRRWYSTLCGERRSNRQRRKRSERAPPGPPRRAYFNDNSTWVSVTNRVLAARVRRPLPTTHSTT